MTVSSIMERLSAQNPFRSVEPLDDPPRPDEFAIPRHLPATAQIPHIQSQLNILTYNHLPQTFFLLEKHRSLQSILGTAKEILTEALPIRCLEATFVGLYLTQCLRGVDRIPLSFKSRVKKNVFRHIVLVIRVTKPVELYGAIGLSRKAGLMYKPMKFNSLYDLIMDYRHEYSLIGHELIDVKLGLAVLHNSSSLMHPCWRYIVIRLHSFSSSFVSAEKGDNEDDEEKKLQGKAKDSAGEGKTPSSSPAKNPLSPMVRLTEVEPDGSTDCVHSAAACAMEGNSSDKARAGCAGDTIDVTKVDQDATSSDLAEYSHTDNDEQGSSSSSSSNSRQDRVNSVNKSSDGGDHDVAGASSLPTARARPLSAPLPDVSSYPATSLTSCPSPSASTNKGDLGQGCVNAKSTAHVRSGLDESAPSLTPPAVPSSTPFQLPSTTTPPPHTSCSLGLFLYKYCKLLSTISDQYYRGLLSAGGGSSSSTQNRALRLCYMDLDKAERDSKAENHRRIQYIHSAQSPLSIEARSAAAKRLTRGAYLKRTPTASLSLTIDSAVACTEGAVDANKQQTIHGVDKGRGKQSCEYEDVAASGAAAPATTLHRVPHSHDTTVHADSVAESVAIGSEAVSVPITMTSATTAITSSLSTSSSSFVSSRAVTAVGGAAVSAGSHTSRALCVSVPAVTTATSAESSAADTASLSTARHTTATICSKPSSSTSRPTSVRGSSSTRLSSSRKRMRSLKQTRIDSSSAHRVTSCTASHCSTTASRRFPCASSSSLVARTQRDLSCSLKRVRTRVAESGREQPSAPSTTSRMHSHYPPHVCDNGTTRERDASHGRAASECTTGNTMISTLTVTSTSAHPSTSTAMDEHSSSEVRATKAVNSRYSSNNNNNSSCCNSYDDSRPHRSSSTSAGSASRSSRSTQLSSYLSRHRSSSSGTSHIACNSTYEESSSSSTGNTRDLALACGDAQTVSPSTLLPLRRCADDSTTNSSTSASKGSAADSVLFHAQAP